MPLSILHEKDLIEIEKLLNIVSTNILDEDRSFICKSQVKSSRNLESTLWFENKKSHFCFEVRGVNWTEEERLKKNIEVCFALKSACNELEFWIGEPTTKHRFKNSFCFVSTQNQSQTEIIVSSSNKGFVHLVEGGREGNLTKNKTARLVLNLKYAASPGASCRQIIQGAYFCLKEDESKRWHSNLNITGNDICCEICEDEMEENGVISSISFGSIEIPLEDFLKLRPGSKVLIPISEVCNGSLLVAGKQHARVSIEEAEGELSITIQELI